MMAVAWAFRLLGYGANDLLGGIGHGIAADDGEPAFGERLLTGHDVVAFEADDEGKLESGFAHGGDDAGRDDIAVHDAAENIDEDRLHRGVAEDDLERGRDLLLARAAADVEEVGRAGAEVLDDIHRGHGEAGAVDQAGDAAVE